MSPCSLSNTCGQDGVTEAVEAGFLVEIELGLQKFL